MLGKIILSNGQERSFYLEEKEVTALEREIESIKQGNDDAWNLADEITFMIHDYARKLMQKENEPAGGSRAGSSN